MPASQTATIQQSPAEDVREISTNTTTYTRQCTDQIRSYTQTKLMTTNDTHGRCSCRLATVYTPAHNDTNSTCAQIGVPEYCDHIYTMTTHKHKHKLDGVLGTQTSRLLLSYCISRSHGTVVCTTTCKERNCCRPRDPASWPNMAATPDDCERTATVALPTAASGGSISGDLGSSAALDVFSTVYELPLTRF